MKKDLFSFAVVNALKVALFVVLLGSCTASPDSVQPEGNPTQSETDAKEIVRSDERKTILFFGDSITAGFGIGEEEAFPALIQQKLDSLGLQWKAVNAGLSGETSAGGLRRIDWLLQQKIDILVLELGGNDGLRGVSPEQTRQNLAGIIEKTRATYPDCIIILAGMQIPPNLGQDYADAFAAVFTDVAETHDTYLIPFILEGVGGDPRLNLPDGIHPTAQGHRIVAETVWDYVEPLVLR
jgi:acyl-CoA thioesterase-1